MKKLLEGFGLAWNMLSIIPLFSVHNFYKGINGVSAMFYPVVGFLLGSILYGVGYLLEGIVPPIHLHIIIFALWVVLTGALHLDGFSDTIDGVFVPKEKALEVMKDSHVGGMGMIFSVVFLLLKASAVVYLPLVYLPLVMAFSRFYSVVVIYFFPYISKGVGKLLKEEIKISHLIVSFGFVFIVGIIYAKVMLLVLGALFTLMVAFLFYKRYRGLNGDIYGFLIELSELFIMQFLLSYNL